MRRGRGRGNKEKGGDRTGKRKRGEKRTEKRKGGQDGGWWEKKGMERLRRERNEGEEGKDRVGGGVGNE